MSSEKAVAALLGKTHAPAAPAMTPDTRKWIGRVLDDEYKRGWHEAIASVSNSAAWREAGMLAAGLTVGAIGMWRILA